MVAVTNMSKKVASILPPGQMAGKLKTEGKKFQQEPVDFAVWGGVFFFFFWYS